MADLQCGWLLLLLCASTRADYALRNLPPDLSEGFAEQHDNNAWGCLPSQNVHDSTGAAALALPGLHEVCRDMSKPCRVPLKKLQHIAG